MSLDRREFLVVLGAGAVLGLQFGELRKDLGEDPFPVPQPGLAELAETPESLAMVETEVDNGGLSFAGTNMDGWRTVLGDARHTAAGLERVNIDDIQTTHDDDASTLIANTEGRGVMAHNITYLRRVDDALDYVHRTSLSVRTPTKPERVSGRPNGQTLEVALFVWDGQDTRRDIGLALQWMLNPWADTFGGIRTWTSDGEEAKWSTEPVAWLDPDDEWHTIDMVLDPRPRNAALTLDGHSVPAQCTETPKPDNWARTTAAALQVELVSLWPDDRPTAPTTYAQCKDWSWEWQPTD